MTKVYFIAILLVNSFIIVAQSNLSRENKKQLANEKAEEIVSAVITETMTEFEKVLVLHEYITKNVEYGKLNGETSAWTALIHNRSDCVGFARGLHALFEAAHINSVVVVREEGHLWVKVKLYGKYYNIDPTWCALKSKWSQYSWFLLSDDQNIDNAKGIYHILKTPERHPQSPDLFHFDQSYYQNKELLKSTEKIRIMGTISLPDGEKAPKGGIIGALNGDRFKIPYNENSVFFITSISRDAKNPVVKYTLSNDRITKYASVGYLGKNGTVLGRHEAKKLDVSGEDASSARITLRHSKYYFSGEICFPKRKVAPPKGEYVTMILTEVKEQKIKYHKQVFIPENDNSTDFKIDISPNDVDKEFYLYYWSPKIEKEGYNKYGFYNKKKTVTEKAKKEIISVKRKPKRLKLTFVK